MAATAGRSAALWIDEFDFQGDLNAMGLHMTCNLGDDTAYGDTWRSHLWTMKEWSLDLGALYEGTSTAGEIDKELQTLFGSTAKVIFVPAGKTDGSVAYLSNAPIYGSHEVNAPVEDLVTLAANFQGTALERGILVHTGTITSAGTTYSSSVDLLSHYPLAHYGTDIMNNGGFETAGGGGADIWANWTEVVSDGALANETSLVRTGNDAAKVTAGASVDTSVDMVYTGRTAGALYRLSFWTRGDGTYAGRYRVWDTSGAAAVIDMTSTGVTGTTYTKVTNYFTSPSTQFDVELFCPGTDGGIAYFDDVELDPFTHGGASYLTVPVATGSGCNMIVTLQDSPNDSDWATVKQFDQIFETATSERSVTAASVDRYLRVEMAVSGASPTYTFAVFFSPRQANIGYTG